jgi:hypothetical protein
VLRRAKHEPVEADLLADAMALCVQSYRPRPVSYLIERGERLPLTDPRVREHPQFWAAAIPMTTVLARTGG